VKAREAAAAANRLQRSTRFRVIASIVVALVAAVGYSVWLASAIGAGEATQTLAAPGGATPAAGESAPPLTVDALRVRVRTTSAWQVVGFGVAAFTGLSLGVIWLGLALTYLALGALAGGVALPLWLYQPTHGLGQVLLGAAALTASFSVLIRAVRAALGANRPVLAIAQNVIDEAVRMKISLVFIIGLIALLATMPQVLDPEQPLRYRVQSFLQYSTTGTLWTLALLTLFFSTATVAFEQRDRLIWQTMVKPVSPVGYLVGKWIGVAALNLALVAVASAGVFLFVETMRDQPAQGEIRPFLMADGRPGITADRRILETEVLAARAGASFDEPEIVPERVEERVTERMAEALQRDVSLRDDTARQAALARDMRAEIIKTATEQYRAVPPGGRRSYRFSGLGAAAALDRPLTVRFRADAGSDNPTVLYRISFLSAAGLTTRQIPLGVASTFTLPPSAIDATGSLVLAVVNGDVQQGVGNPLTITFPPDGLEVLYTAGSYESNFARVAVAMWIKLAFLGAVGIAAATFLSFPVACLLTLLVLFSAESAGFLRESLEEYPLRNNIGQIDWLAVAMNLIANPIASAFQVYSDLNPTSRLVDGRLIGWGALGKGIAVLGAWTMGTLGLGWAIFRKRELAIYSGH